MCGAMEQDGSYDFAAAFARLTFMFEDAVGVASKEQAAGLSRLQQMRLTGQLSVLHRDASNIVKELGGAFDR